MKENPLSNSEIKKNTDYLTPLFENIEKAYVDQLILTFRIVEPKTNGFVIKVGGLFAFLLYKDIGWKYSNLDVWRDISETFIGVYFKGKIKVFDKEKRSIFVEAKEKAIQLPKLGKGRYYKCVICNITDYGAFVDLGVHFKWRYGSIFGLIHKSSMYDPLDIEKWKAGDLSNVLFHGYDEKERLILGDIYSRPTILQEEIAPILDEIHLINVKVDDQGRYSFSLFDKYAVSIPIQKAIYPSTRRVIRSYLKELKDGDLIYCKLLKVNMKKNKIIARLHVSEI